MVIAFTAKHAKVSLHRHCLLQFTDKDDKAVKLLNNSQVLLECYKPGQALDRVGQMYQMHWRRPLD